MENRYMLYMFQISFLKYICFVHFYVYNFYVQRLCFRMEMFERNKCARRGVLNVTWFS